MVLLIFLKENTDLFTLKEKIDISFQSLGIIISIATLILAYIIMTYFQKQQVSIKQLDKVTELIDYINNHRIRFTIGYSSGNLFGGSVFNLTLFEIKNLKFDDTDFNSSPVYLDQDSKGIGDFSNFINNPLIPICITEELKNFNSLTGKAIYISDIETMYKSTDNLSAAIITSDCKENISVFNITPNEKHVYIEYNAFSCNNWCNFKECSINLERAIKNWLKKYKINDIKIND